jgi:hypothetical protein
MPGFFKSILEARIQAPYSGLQGIISVKLLMIFKFDNSAALLRERRRMCSFCRFIKDDLIIKF